MKNTFNYEKQKDLIEARKKVVEILMHDLPSIIEERSMSNCMFICVPRAKNLKAYSDSQLMFKESIRSVAKDICGVSDGIDCIKRFKDTCTTHLLKATEEGRISDNVGDKPYPGITVNTCKIDKDRIESKNIILIDDIYTKSINIDEDCIQALFDNGANEVVFYSIGYTRRI